MIPDTVFTLSGFDFAELHFVISADRQNLVAIDMGTTPKSAQAAYEYLRRQKPNLPNLTTVFVTHSHWDHIGGHAYFRQLNPELIMVTRDNYAEELTRVVNTPRGFGYFFGADFAPDDVSGFKSDRLIADSQTITVGGTAFDLIPIQGGETEDAMLIHLPKYSTVFVGDFIMPYIGAPFIEEGNVEGLLDALDVVGNLKAQHILHGHGPLTALFGSAEMLVELRAHLAWLQDAVLKSLRQEGLSRPALHHLNLMPPNLTKTPLTQLPFLVLRENLINRLYDQQTGYWQTNLDGIDHLSDRELGALIVRYLGVSAVKLQKAVETMHQNGDYELAARALRWTHSQFPDHEALEPLKLKTYRKLQERFQQLNPFKFILYSEIIRDETPPIR